MNEILESQSDSCHNKKLIKKIISLFHSISLALSAVPSPCVGKKKKKIYMIFFFFFFCSFNECTQHHTFSVHTIELVIQIRLAHGKIGTKLLWGLSTAYGNIQRFRSCLPKGVRGKLHGYLIWLWSLNSAIISVVNISRGTERGWNAFKWENTCY